jgi:hypothetical protein
LTITSDQARPASSSASTCCGCSGPPSRPKAPRPLPGATPAPRPDFSRLARLLVGLPLFCLPATRRGGEPGGVPSPGAVRALFRALSGPFPGPFLAVPGPFPGPGLPFPVIGARRGSGQAWIRKRSAFGAVARRPSERGLRRPCRAGPRPYADPDVSAGGWAGGGWLVAHADRGFPHRSLVEPGGNHRGNFRAVKESAAAELTTEGPPFPAWRGPAVAASPSLPSREEFFASSLGPALRSPSTLNS